MPNDDVAAFLAYAESFEKSIATDDWSHVDRQTHDQIVWNVAGSPPIGGVYAGREATMGAIRASVAAFDRRFDAREPRILVGPTPIPGGIHMTWAVTYRREGLPDFVLKGEEWDLFRDGKLILHREVIHNEAELFAYLAKHAAKLRPAA